MLRSGPKRRRRRVVVAMAVAAAVLGVAAVGLTYTPVFGARHIKVRGNEVLGADRVVAVAGLELGANVAHLDTDAVETRLLQDPWVAAATVERDLPSTIIIRVHERVPMARVLDGPVLAGDGTILPDASPAALPEIRVMEGEADAVVAVGAAEAIAAMPPVLRASVAAIVVHADGTLNLELHSGVQVDYGQAEDLVAKGETLRAVLRWAEAEGSELTGVNVSVPTAPTATLDGSTTPVG